VKCVLFAEFFEYISLVMYSIYSLVEI